MKYPNIHQATFLSRPNRFIAKVLLNGQEETVHVKNTGRCRELLVAGCTVYLVESDNPARKTRYDLVSVEKPREGQAPLLINMDSQAPNHIFQEFAESGGFLPRITLIRPETTYGNSRFDFYLEAVERKIFAEVKGCTLEENGVCRFPDAPTERGVKHVHELISCLAEGYEAWLVIVVQMAGMKEFRPNDETDPAFGNAVRAAKAAGVHIAVYSCAVTADTVQINGTIPAIL